MKKLALSSLLAVFAVTGAQAANVIDGNPLYRPGEGRFYSETSLMTNTDFEDFVLGEGFGYGITDKLSVFLDTSLSYVDNPAVEFGWDFLSAGLSYRYLDQGEWKADVYGKVAQIYSTGKNFDTLETNWYNWTLGTKAGYVAGDWTLAGVVEADYRKDDLKGFDYESWYMKVGLEGQYVMDSNWSFIAGLDYNFDIAADDFYGDDDQLNAKIGANYNIDSTKYIGAFLFKEITTDFDENPLGFGLKFGIDF